MELPSGDFIKSSAAYTSGEFSAMDNEKHQQQQFSSQFFQELQQQQLAQTQVDQQMQQQQQQQRRSQTRPRRSPKSSISAYSAWARSQAMASVYILKAHSIRSTFYIIASVPCFLRAPNYTGGLCLTTSGLTYAVAAILANRKSKGKGKDKGKPQSRSFS
ncbi:hypothetical protein BG015_003319 [Linnemannia schmuckeri]|uniref:Uncharacterized protein n=1 Tax=Linnemannia schmuckeri TaxID=64567 RepID=A0A9P5S4U2_9FUNG|nr:hypothetical protein BG015_003319 [Linnemannia schmuckeri]